MDFAHPQLMIDVAAAAQRERLAMAASDHRAAILTSRGTTPRAALALALVALAGRVAPSTIERRADLAV